MADALPKSRSSGFSLVRANPARGQLGEVLASIDPRAISAKMAEWNAVRRERCLRGWDCLMSGAFPVLGSGPCTEQGG